MRVMEMGMTEEEQLVVNGREAQNEERSGDVASKWASVHHSCYALYASWHTSRSSWWVHLY